MKIRIYEPPYRFPFVPIEWIFGSHTKLVELVEKGQITLGRATDLGCGEGSGVGGCGRWFPDCAWWGLYGLPG